LRLERPPYKELSDKRKSGRGPVNLGGQRRVGKRGTLEEDSSLGLKGIDMLDVDLGRLVGGRSCTIPCTLFRNGYQVLTSALADSGANAFALIDTQYAVKLADFLNAPIKELPKPIPIRGYNGRIGPPITTILRIHLRVDGRR